MVNLECRIPPDMVRQYYVGLPCIVTKPSHCKYFCMHVGNRNVYTITVIIIIIIIIIAICLLTKRVYKLFFFSSVSTRTEVQNFRLA
jgi:hypothetical protein